MPDTVFSEKRTDSKKKRFNYMWQLYNNTHKNSRTKSTMLIMVVLMVMALQFEKHFFIPF